MSLTDAQFTLILVCKQLNVSIQCNVEFCFIFYRNKPLHKSSLCLTLILFDSSCTFCERVNVLEMYAQCTH